MKPTNTLGLALFPLSQALKLKEKIVPAKPAKESAEAEKALLDAKKALEEAKPPEDIRRNAMKPSRVLMRHLSKVDELVHIEGGFLTFPKLSNSWHPPAEPGSTHDCYDIAGVYISAIDLLFSYHRKCFGMILNYSIGVPDFHP
jgi:hypothetical protein